MSEKDPSGFDEYLEKVLGPIAPRARRKQNMREELLEHLRESSKEELGRHSDKTEALRAALKRLGRPDELRSQLQNSIPFLERMLFSFLNRKEPLMLRLMWFTGIVVWILGSQLHFAHNEQIEFAGVGLFFGCTFWHLCQKDNLAARLIGPRWPFLIGAVTLLFGTAVILPAMAKINHEGFLEFLSAEALVLGILITMGGFAHIILGINKLRARSI